MSMKTICATRAASVHTDICSAVSTSLQNCSRNHFMNIVSWDPMLDVDQLFSRPLGGLLMGRWPRSLMKSEVGEAVWTPTLDVSETDAEYLVRADLPAVRKEDVSVTIEDDVLTIAGERKFEKQESSEK